MNEVYVSTPMPLRLEAKLSWASREMQLGEDIAENSGMLWLHRVDAIGGCVVDWGGQQHTEVCLLYGDKSMNKGLISEDRGNKATLLLTIPCSLLSRLQRIYRSQYLD